MDWKTGSYEDNGSTVYTNPNGNPKDNIGYYTQPKRFYDDYMEAYNDHWASYYSKTPIERDEDKYDDWEQMHKGVTWFDTAGCWKGPFIGEVNDVVIAPDTSVNTQFNNFFEFRRNF